MNSRPLIAALDKDASLDMDLTARMRILEGALGLTHGDLSRDKRHIGAALREIPQQHPAIAPEWFAIKDFGLYESLLQGARKVLKDESVGTSTAEEIAQNVAAGLNPSGGAKKDAFGEVGKHFASAIQSGSKTPKQLGSVLFAFAQRAALDAWRQKKRQREQQGETVSPEDLGGQSSADVMVDRSPMDVVLSLLSSPKGNNFKRWLYETVSRKGTAVQKAILDLFLDNPHLGKREIAESPAVVEAMGGRPSSPQNISNHWSRMVELIKDEMKQNPHVTDWIDEYLDVASLGHGGGTLRSAAQKVAARYAAGRVAARYLQRQAGLGVNWPTKNLPKGLQAILKGIGFNKRQITVHATNSYTVYSPGDDGNRGKVLLVALPSCVIREELDGQFGGGGLGKPSPVDTDEKPKSFPADTVVVKGQKGGATYFSIYAPGNMLPLLGTPS